MVDSMWFSVVKGEMFGPCVQTVHPSARGLSQSLDSIVGATLPGGSGGVNGTLVLPKIGRIYCRNWLFG